MAPLNEKKPALCGSKRPYDDLDENTNGEEHCGANRIQLDCLFQIETFRQAATDSISATGGMNSVYIVRPIALWDSMSRYKNFSINDEHFAVHDDVYIARFFTHFNQPRHGAPSSVSSRIEREEWAARVLEIRGVDQAHVYLRVMWFYTPEELPHGRQEYHGSEELIATNDMSIVLGSRVTAHADISHWIETDQDEPAHNHRSPYFWRQTYNKTTGQLSDLPTYCTCFDPQNPDEPLIRCTEPDCSVRMHPHCILESFETDLYERAQRRDHDDAARFPPGTMFTVEIVNVEDPHNDDVDDDGVEEPPWLEITDHRCTPPEVWEQEIVCLNCEAALA